MRNIYQMIVDLRKFPSSLKMLSKEGIGGSRPT